MLAYSNIFYKNPLEGNLSLTGKLEGSYDNLSFKMSANGSKGAIFGFRGKTSKLIRILKIPKNLVEINEFSMTPEDGGLLKLSNAELVLDPLYLSGNIEALNLSS